MPMRVLRQCLLFALYLFPSTENQHVVPAVPHAEQFDPKSPDAIEFRGGSSVPSPRGRVLRT